MKLKTGKSMVVCIVSAVALATGCNQPAFEGTTNGTTDPNANAAGEGLAGSGGPGANSLALTCDQEKQAVASVGVAGASASGAAVVSVSSSVFCQNATTSTQTTAVRKAADIVFIVDTTGSMQPHINTVKQNLLAFANMVAGKGWDLRYGLVTYKDGPDVQSPGLVDATGIYGLVSPLYAAGGADMQEAGQLAIENGLNMIIQDSNANPARRSADKILLLITDAPSYTSNGNHNDLGVEGLVNKVRGIYPAYIPNLSFFHSTAGAGFLGMNGVGGVTANGQMSGFLQQMGGMRGRALAFPFTNEAFLSDFGAEFNTQVIPGVEVCKLQGIELQDLSGRVLAPGQAPTAVGDIVTARYDIPPGTGAVNAVYKRCCGADAAQAASCAKRDDRKVSVQINR